MDLNVSALINRDVSKECGALQRGLKTSLA